MFTLRLFALSAVLILFLASDVDGSERLAEQAGDGFRNDVLVLGTAHLAGYEEQLERGDLAETLNVLERFAPTRIGVEQLSPGEIALLAELASHDPAARELLTMFGGRTLEAGRAVQARLGLERVEAARRADALVAKGAGLKPEDRRYLVALLVAAYDWPSAILQWSYLAGQPKDDEDEMLPGTVKRRLDAALSSMDEVESLAVPLARRLGLQRIYSIDSQLEAVRTLSLPRDKLEALFADPARRNWRLPEVAAKENAIREDAIASGNLLPWYRWMNSPEFMAHDARQWHWLMNDRHDGLARFRYAMWELRNQRILVNVLDAVASTEPERLLVLIGSAHKQYLDDALGRVMSVRLLQFEEYSRVRPDR